jgi:hypothetical protein
MVEGGNGEIVAAKRHGSVPELFQELGEAVSITFVVRWFWALDGHAVHERCAVFETFLGMHWTRRSRRGSISGTKPR